MTFEVVPGNGSNWATNRFVKGGRLATLVTQMSLHTWNGLLAAAGSITDLRFEMIGISDYIAFILKLLQGDKPDDIKKHMGRAMERLTGFANKSFGLTGEIIGNLTDVKLFASELSAAAKSTYAHNDKEAGELKIVVAVNEAEAAVREEMLAWTQDMHRQQRVTHQKLQGDYELFDAETQWYISSSIFGRRYLIDPKFHYTIPVPATRPEKEDMEAELKNEWFLDRVWDVVMYLNSTVWMLEQNNGSWSAKIGVRFVNGTSRVLENLPKDSETSRYYPYFGGVIGELREFISQNTAALKDKPEQFAQRLRTISGTMDIAIRKCITDFENGTTVLLHVYDTLTNIAYLQHREGLKFSAQIMERYKKREEALLDDVLSMNQKIMAASLKVATTLDVVELLENFCRMINLTENGWARNNFVLDGFRTAVAQIQRYVNVLTIDETAGDENPLKQLGELRSIITRAIPIRMHAKTLANILNVFDQVYRDHVLKALTGVRRLIGSGQATIAGTLQMITNESTRAQNVVKRMADDKRKILGENYQSDLRRLAEMFTPHGQVDPTAVGRTKREFRGDENFAKSFVALRSEIGNCLLTADIPAMVHALGYAMATSAAYTVRLETAGNKTNEFGYLASYLMRIVDSTWSLVSVASRNMDEISMTMRQAADNMLEIVETSKEPSTKTSEKRMTKLMNAIGDSGRRAKVLMDDISVPLNTLRGQVDVLAKEMASKMSRTKTNKKELELLNEINAAAEANTDNKSKVLLEELERTLSESRDYVDGFQKALAEVPPDTLAQGIKVVLGHIKKILQLGLPYLNEALEKSMDIGRTEGPTHRLAAKTENYTLKEQMALETLKLVAEQANEISANASGATPRRLENLLGQMVTSAKVVASAIKGYTDSHIVKKMYDLLVELWTPAKQHLMAGPSNVLCVEGQAKNFSNCSANPIEATVANVRFNITRQAQLAGDAAAEKFSALRAANKEALACSTDGTPHQPETVINASVNQLSNFSERLHLGKMAIVSSEDETQRREAIDKAVRFVMPVPLGISCVDGNVSAEIKHFHESIADIVVDNVRAIGEELRKAEMAHKAKYPEWPEKAKRFIQQAANAMTSHINNIGIERYVVVVPGQPAKKEQIAVLQEAGAKYQMMQNALTDAEEAHKRLMQTLGRRSQEVKDSVGVSMALANEEAVFRVLANAISVMEPVAQRINGFREGLNTTLNAVVIVIRNQKMMDDLVKNPFFDQKPVSFMQPFQKIKTYCSILSRVAASFVAFTREFAIPEISGLDGLAAETNLTKVIHAQSQLKDRCMNTYSSVWERCKVDFELADGEMTMCFEICTNELLSCVDVSLHYRTEEFCKHYQTLSRMTLRSW